jgi:hypothetical protein
MIHEVEARRQNTRRYRLGGLAAILAAGSSTLAAAHSTSEDATLAVLAAVSALAAAAFAGLLTALDPGGQSEAHRRAATSYKSFLRAFEEKAGALGCNERSFDQVLLQDLKTKLEEADESAPPVPVKLGREVENRRFDFVPKAIDLLPNAKPDNPSPSTTSRPD